MPTAINKMLMHGYLHENYQFNIHIMFDEGKIFILSALLSIDQFPKANLDLFEIWKEGSPVLGFEP